MNARPIGSQVVFWHRDLPPITARLMADHTVEASSGRVPGTLARRDELWHRCYDELMASAEDRLRQEIERLGGRYAHVYEEVIVPKRDAATGEAWLHGPLQLHAVRGARRRRRQGSPGVALAPS